MCTFHEQYTDGSSGEDDSFAILYQKSQYHSTRRHAARIHVYIYIMYPVKSWYSIYRICLLTRARVSRKSRGVSVAVFAETETPDPPRARERVSCTACTRRRGDIVEKWGERIIGLRVTPWVIHEPAPLPGLPRPPFLEPFSCRRDRPTVRKSTADRFYPSLCAWCRINIQFLYSSSFRPEMFFSSHRPSLLLFVRASSVGHASNNWHLCCSPVIWALM